MRKTRPIRIVALAFLVAAGSASAPGCGEDEQRKTGTLAAPDPYIEGRAKQSMETIKQEAQQKPSR